MWRSSIGNVSQHAVRVLDAAEQNRLRRIQVPIVRDHFIAGRFFVRSILARYLGSDPAAIRFEATAGGKPVIREPQTPIEFNLSHSHGLVLLTLGRQALGIDIERLRPIRDSLSIARRVLAATDIQQLEQVDEPARSVAFLACWTRFEACQKTLGRGVFAKPATKLTRTLGFRVDATHMGCLAWLAQDADPKVSWFSANI